VIILISLISEFNFANYKKYILILLT